MNIPAILTSTDSMLCHCGHLRAEHSLEGWGDGSPEAPIHWGGSDICSVCPAHREEHTFAIRR